MEELKLPSTPVEALPTYDPLPTYNPAPQPTYNPPTTTPPSPPPIQPNANIAQRTVLYTEHLVLSFRLQDTYFFFIVLTVKEHSYMIQLENYIKFRPSDLNFWNKREKILTFDPSLICGEIFTKNGFLKKFPSEKSFALIEWPFHCLRSFRSYLALLRDISQWFSLRPK